MTRTCAAILMAMAVAGYDASAQSTPNFSGTWTMNGVKSDFGLLPAPASIVRTITHAEPSITIVEEQDAGLGIQTTTRIYTTDGKDVTFTSNGAEIKGKAVWEGNEMVVTSDADIIMLKFVDRMSLSADGRTLTSAIHITSPQGDADVRVVFEKK